MISSAEIEQVVGSNLQPSTSMVLRLGSVVEQHRAKHAGVSRNLHSRHSAMQPVSEIATKMYVNEAIRGEGRIQVHSGQSRFKSQSLGMDVEHGGCYEACAANDAQTAWRFGEEEATIGGKRQRPRIVEAGGNVFCMQRLVIGDGWAWRWSRAGSG